jgi:hypothetical protein
MMVKTFCVYASEVVIRKTYFKFLMIILAIGLSSLQNLTLMFGLNSYLNSYVKYPKHKPKILFISFVNNLPWSVFTKLLTYFTITFKICLSNLQKLRFKSSPSNTKNDHKMILNVCANGATALSTTTFIRTTLGIMLC